MAKLIALLVFSALVAFATAHTAIVTTTTIDDENPISSHRQCSQRLQGQRFNQCRMHLEQGQVPLEEVENCRKVREQLIEQCCEELQNVDEQCQCEAVKHVFRQVHQQQQQQHQQQTGPFGGSQQIQRLKQKAEMLPNQCNLRSRQCSIGSIMTTTTTTTNVCSFRPYGSDSHQCRESEIERPVNQCQTYVQQKMRSQRSLTLPMSIVDRRQGKESEGLEQCCNQLQNVKRECQCKAIEEVARKVMRQQQQQGGRRQYGGQQEEGQMKIVSRVVQNLPNQCDLDVRQCNISY